MRCNPIDSYQARTTGENAEYIYSVLEATLASTPLVQFLNSVWAVRAFQSGKPECGARYLKNAPIDGATADLTNRHAIYPWELELLVNERLAVPVDALFQQVDPSNWNQIAAFVNLVRSLENEEAAKNSPGRDIIDHLFRIGSRQFDWQTGFLSRQEIFRNIFVYGQGECARRFEEKYRITINEFTAACFGFFTLVQDFPQAEARSNLSLVGVNDQARQKTLSIISKPIREMRAIASKERTGTGETAFKPSILRTYPLIQLGSCSSLLSCPLPDLLLNRMTSGLFYDIIDGGGPIRDEIGKQFERYVELSFNHLAPEISIQREFSYKTKKGQRKSPDLTIFNEKGELSHLFECKANRLSQIARFGNFEPDELGYREMIKGVVQIWRFIADTRLGLTDSHIALGPVGAILTLDSWFVAAPKRQEAVLSKARAQCSDRYPDVLEEDQIPIAFIYMPEFERAMAMGESAALLDTLSFLSTQEGQGYQFDIAMLRGGEKFEYRRDFPFEKHLCELLPWWEALANLR